MMEDPQTSCGCFECIVAISSDLQGVIVVNREYTDMTPIGAKFSTLAGSVGVEIKRPGSSVSGGSSLRARSLYVRMAASRESSGCPRS